ncbi:putative nuclease HARBI1 [Anoplophora glabripennis]|uniref:putative nuclease HARBI1 n=1 Tax=Anoplophora glabripennis TaxID=217634 RepID=UPI00087513FD|nr:putative nuclease HARBI1 [Anoplophora glabripennis]
MNLFEKSSSSSSDEEEFIVIRRPKLYRKRVDCFEKYDDLNFFQRFRLRKTTVLSLLQEIEDVIKLPTQRGGCITPMQQLLLTLRFYASGNMQIAVADFLGVSTSSACRIIKRVSRALASLRAQYIKMYSDNREMERSAEKFYQIASFPRIIGAIDCTLIKIDSPGGIDAEIFRSRKSYFALNVQTVSDASLKIRDIVARWPGSVHDQTIFNNSNLRDRFENGEFGRYILIGDSGYSLRSYLMTKLLQTRTPAENLYNESIIRTRNVVERQYGVWKRRFPILRYGMRLKLDTTMAVIVATAVLHNIAIDMNDLLPEDLLYNEEMDNNEDILQPVENNLHMGHNIRQLLINEHFASL